MELYTTIDSSNGMEQLYVNESSNSAKLSVFDLNGSLDRDIHIASNRYSPKDLVLDDNGTIYIAERYAVTCLQNDGTFKWRLGKNASISNYGVEWDGNGEFNDAYGITIGPDGNLYVADRYNHTNSGSGQKWYIYKKIF